jgi:hypothetical protein
MNALSFKAYLFSRKFHFLFPSATTIGIIYYLLAPPLQWLRGKTGPEMKTKPLLST